MTVRFDRAWLGSLAVPTLTELLSDPTALPYDGTLYVVRPWAATAEAVADEAKDAPLGYEYLLEVHLALDVLETWSSWRGGRRPTAEEAADAVIYYAEQDAYPPVT